MKTELIDESDVRKHLSFEIEPDVLESEIARVAARYSRSARVPGFRPGKVPAKVVRQRYKDQILYDVAHDLIPRVVGDALKERGLDPVATPDIKDVVIEEGRPLTFVADFEVTPPIDPGDYAGITLRKPPAVLEVGAVDQALERMREGAAKYLPVEDRPAAAGDSLLLDLVRTVQRDGAAPEPLQNVSIELGAAANPPGFDEHLTGRSAGDQVRFATTYPAEYEAAELAGRTVDYDATVKGIRRKEVPALDDEFAKEVSDVETLDALRARVHEDLQHQAEHDADHEVRHALLQELASRVAGDVPDALVEREVERRLEDLVRRLLEQGLDPRKANIDWADLRARQRDAAASAVRSTLVLDEIARREGIEATDDDVAREIATFAERAGRTPAAVRARLEKEGELDRIRRGIQREKTMGWLLEKATIAVG